jgi:cell division protease FtsH
MKKRVKFSLWYYLLMVVAILGIERMLFPGPSVEEISYSEFVARVKKDTVQSVVVTDTRIYGLMKPDSSAGAATSPDSTAVKPPPKKTPWRLRIAELETGRDEENRRRFTVVPMQDNGFMQLLEDHNVDFGREIKSHGIVNFLLNWILPFGAFVLLWGFVMRRMGRGPGALSLGKSKARIYDVEQSQRVRFTDVAGIEEAVEEVGEIVDFLTDPSKYTKLGAKLPKGVLLVGPPGTGKTLLARAVAGEAGVPFFSLTGSDFVEMFVGVGAARVRDLFTSAKGAAPCIIFIDELDALGRSRVGAVPVGGYDERENTLNQLLAEMDGFDPQVGIVMMGATNRPEVLDPALLRPGRFDRQILVDKPDLNGRLQIFQIHVRGLLLADDVDLRALASETPGFAGAEIANLCNEAALLANRKGHEKIQMEDLQDAIERVIAGLEKKNKRINEKERRIVAYHESGHAIIGHYTPGADPVRKVSIVPRGLGALGYTLQSPLEDRYLMSRTELLGKIKGLLGGRAAEEIIFSDISTGASDDLQKASRLAREMLTVYGMSKRLPNLAVVRDTEPRFLVHDRGQARYYSDKIEQTIDEEVLEILRESYEHDKRLLETKRDKLEEMAQLLQEKEKIDEEDIERILGPRAA